MKKETIKEMEQSEIVELFNKMGLYCGDDKELTECFKKHEGAARK